MKALIVGVFLVTAAANAATDSLVNPAFNPRKIPPPTEAPLDLSTTTAQWDMMMRTKPALKCDTQEIWESQPGSKINVTALKDKKVPVKAFFDQVRVLLFVDKSSKTIKAGQGSINLSSYHSGVEARDRRVQKYVLQADQPLLGISMLSFTFNPPPKVPTTPGSTTSSATVDLVLDNEHLKSVIPVKITLNPDSTLQLTSEKDGNLDFVTAKSKSRLLALMEACNHHFVGKTVQVGVDTKLTDLCAAQANSPTPTEPVKKR